MRANRISAYNARQDVWECVSRLGLKSYAAEGATRAEAIKHCKALHRQSFFVINGGKS